MQKALGFCFFFAKAVMCSAFNRLKSDVFHFCVYLADDKCRKRKTDKMDTSRLLQLCVLGRFTAAAACSDGKTGSHLKCSVEIKPVPILNKR